MPFLHLIAAAFLAHACPVGLAHECRGDICTESVTLGDSPSIDDHYDQVLPFIETDGAGESNVSLIQRGRLHLEKQRVLPSCAAGWGNFGEEPLTRSQAVTSAHVSPKAFTDFNGGKIHQVAQPFVSTEYEFGMCAISKSAGTSWADIFVKIYHNDTIVTHDTNSMDIASPLDDVQEVFEDPKSVTAVMVREPLSRFASTWLSKCGQKRGIHCFMAHPEPQNTTMRDAVEWMLRQDLPTVEQHWKLQSDACELDERVLEYDFVLRYSKDHTAADAACLMSMAGLDRFNSLGPEHDDEPYWQTPSMTDDEEMELLKTLFTKKAATSLMQKLQQDYETFNFPEPTWIATATGIFYETPYKSLGITSM